MASLRDPGDAVVLGHRLREGWLSLRSAGFKAWRRTVKAGDGREDGARILLGVAVEQVLRQ
jgi:hypothetical protein